MSLSSIGHREDDDNAFTCVIKDFCFSRSERICSDCFVLDKCKWRLIAYPMGNEIEKYMSLYLEVADFETLPHGWKRRIDFRLTIVNQFSATRSVTKETYDWFKQTTPALGFIDMIPHAQLHERDGGFVVNGEIKIFVEVFLFHRVGQLDVSEGSESDVESDGEYDIESSDESEEETMEVGGFRVLDSQANLVSRIFNKYPDVALEVRGKNQHLKTSSMNVLLSLIQTLCRSPHELSEEDLLEADNSLAYVEDAGFKVDWLDKKLEKVKERKKEAQTSATRIQELDEKVKDFKQKLSDMEAPQTNPTRIQELEVEVKNFKQKLSDTKALLEKEKAKAVTARASLTVDDFF